MLISDLRAIGNKLFSGRKKLGLTQGEAAEAAGLSDRTYADIERGTVNMRLETILKICEAFQITPDAILTEEEHSLSTRQEELFEQLSHCTIKQKEAAMELLSVYLKSIR